MGNRFPLEMIALLAASLGSWQVVAHESIRNRASLARPFKGRLDQTLSKQSVRVLLEHGATIDRIAIASPSHKIEPETRALAFSDPPSEENLSMREDHTVVLDDVSVIGGRLSLCEEEDGAARLAEGEDCSGAPTTCVACTSGGQRVGCYRRDAEHAQCMVEGACPDPAWGWGAHECSATFSDGSTIGPAPKATNSQCDASSFERAGACEACPAFSTAEPDNFGVYACRCWEGYAMTFDASAYAHEGTASAVCVPLAWCDGIVDVSTGKCWRYRTARSTWHSAQADCEGWGGNLASVTSDAEKTLADALMDHHGLGNRDAVWIGANDVAQERTWRWVDGSPFERIDSHWKKNRPWTYQHWGSFYDCAVIRKQTADWRPMHDYPCFRSSITSGHLCSMRPQCPAGTYLEGPACLPCPQGATSSPDSNFRAHACQCPDAISLHADGSGAQCVATASCDGIVDAATLKCWKYFDVSAEWAEAEGTCNEWGSALTGRPGHLLSILTASDQTMVANIVQGHGLASGVRLWVGANDVARERNWRWTDGSPYTRDDGMWAAGRPYMDTEHGPGHDCGVVQLRSAGPEMVDSDCEFRNRFLCSTDAFCDAGTYVASVGGRRQCVACPAGATSEPGANFGVEACRCGAGSALLVHADGAVECVAAGHCDGVLDAGTLKCWKLAEHESTATGWQASEAACREWGGHLSSLATRTELQIAAGLMRAGGFGVADGAWVGANDRAVERKWVWSDGSAFEREAWLWRAGRPWTEEQHGPGHDCGMLRGLAADLQLTDQPCGQTARGFLCSRPPQCPAGFFLHLAPNTNAACLRCPSNGTSVPGWNLGVYSCRCPAGHVLSHREGERAESVRCVRSWAECDGVQDEASGKCWTLLTGSDSWWEAKAQCEAWGGTLASVTTETDRSVAAGLMQSGGVSDVGAAWVGASDVGQERRWVWVAGDPFVLQPSMWEEHRPFMETVWGPNHDCAALHNGRTARMKDVLCSGVGSIEGSLCAKPFQCPDNTFLHGSVGCVSCPGNGTSVEGRNFGVLGCTCPAGTALAFNMVEPGTTEPAYECVASAGGCDGVLDMQTLKCWRAFRGSPGWSGAVEACEGWGGALASVLSRQELMLARSLQDAMGLQPTQGLWVGASDAVAEGRWRWADGATFQREAVVWHEHRPYTGGQYGVYHHCGKLVGGRLLDERCDMSGLAAGFVCSRDAWEPAHPQRVLDPVPLIDVCRGCQFLLRPGAREVFRQGECAHTCVQVDLSHSSAEGVAAHTWDGVPILSLDLSYTSLLPLRSEWFDGAGGVAVLRMAGLGLSGLDLDPEVFRAMPHAAHIDLRHNEIAHLDPEVLQHWTQVRSLQVHGSPLACRPVLARPYTADLDLAGLDPCLVRGCSAQVSSALLAQDEEQRALALAGLQRVLGVVRPGALDTVADSHSLWVPRGHSGTAKCWCLPFLHCFDLQPAARAHSPRSLSHTPYRTIAPSTSTSLELHVASAPSAPAPAYPSEAEASGGEGRAGAGMASAAVGVLLVVVISCLTGWALATLCRRRQHKTDKAQAGQRQLSLDLAALPPVVSDQDVCAWRRSSQASTGSQLLLLGPHSPVSVAGVEQSRSPIQGYRFKSVGEIESMGLA